MLVRGNFYAFYTKLILQFLHKTFSVLCYLKYKDRNNPTNDVKTVVSNEKITWCVCRQATKIVLAPNKQITQSYQKA